MRDVNKILLIGYAGRKPELRYTKDGYPVAHFSLATTWVGSRKEVGEGDKKNEHTEWHRVVVWGKQGESCAQYMDKGSQVYVEGSVRSHKYKGKDEQMRTAYEVVAERVKFLGSKRGTGAGDSEFQAETEVEAVAGF